jgi:hypothetical protein
MFASIVALKHAFACPVLTGTDTRCGPPRFQWYGRQKACHEYNVNIIRPPAIRQGQR